MKICIISDTHGNQTATQQAVAIMQEIKPTAVVHCGDIVSLETLDLFVDFNFYFVFGNCDSDTHSLITRAQALGLNPPDYSLELSFADKSFLVHHGNNLDFLGQALASQSFDYILHGHSHEMTDFKEGKTRVINPGALSRVETSSIALLEPASDILRFIEVPS